MCPRLQGITVGRYLMENDDIALTLDAMTDAVELNLGSSYFMEESFRSLMSRHADTIRVIILTRYDAPTSAAVQTIMTSCPSLEVIEAWLIRGRDLVRLKRLNQGGGIGSTVTTEDVVSGGDWVCLGLKSLSMEFSLCRYKQDVEQWDPVGAARFAQRVRLEQEYAFQQLSRLTRLEKLNIKSRGNSPIRSFDLRLESNGGGLDKLASLKRLEYFNFIHTVQDLSDLELNWMLDHWPRLQTMIGTFSKDHKKSDALRAYVNLRLRDRKL
ncbi:hypothetical protein BGZ80_010384 [Entomortierella chlamydospora]|uniref:Uncharacterized protein n=1 Tax=Entomortierella chlamydospora TaxID=101097 RepID=A0A9P6SZT0_9FUNG|nr:hypothetical protein BGZ79_007347 [Entomortierella chlamydospora]KAG0014530.1 hypothetical protein BGZ80_010384 [Entomortierella chlamydospora]